MVRGGNVCRLLDDDCGFRISLCPSLGSDFKLLCNGHFFFPISNTRVMTIINELNTKMLNPSYRFTRFHFTNQLISRSIPRDACPLQNP